MNITKTTINFATKRNIELVIDEDKVAFYNMNDDSEPMFFYAIQENALFFKTNIWLSQLVAEELPYWIKDEKHLREVIQYLSDSLS